MDAEDTLTPAELVARFTADELFDAREENSNQYNGMVLSKALLIVQTRLRCHRPVDISRQLGLTKSTLYRWIHGRPISDATLNRALAQLVFLSMEGLQPRNG